MSMRLLLSKLESNFTSQSTPKVLNIWYDHLPHLKNSVVTQSVMVSDYQCIKYEGDFWGLLQELGVPPAYHPFVTVFNGYTHPSDYKGTPDIILLPDLQEMEVILKVNMTKTNR